MGPLLPVALGATSALGVAQGILSATSDAEYQRYNRDELDKLQKKKKRGGLGISAGKQRLLDQQLNAPVAQAAGEAQARAEQLATASQAASPADLARLRVEAARIRAGGAQQAQVQIQQADAQRAAAQRAEIEQRLQLKAALRNADYQRILGGAAQAAAPIAQAAAAPTGTFSQIDPELLAALLSAGAGGG